MENNDRQVWISWEDHRRSRELANAFEVPFVPLTYDGARWKRYPYLSFKTLIFLIKSKQDVIYCQNPSIVLASLLVVLKRVFDYKLIVDRHSNFKFEHQESKHVKWRLFHWLSRYTVRKADLTIVTNDHLKKVCEEFGGSALVLPDKLPRMNGYDPDNRPDYFDQGEGIVHIMVVTTFNEDEPIAEIIDSLNNLSNKYRLYLTGNYRKQFSEAEKNLLLDKGVLLTGFLSESDYQNLMKHCDAVLVLTKKEYILNCGAYEAISLKKPYIISDTQALRNYFKKGCVYVEPSPKGIANGISYVSENKHLMINEINDFVPEMERDWQLKFDEIVRFRESRLA